MKNYSIITDSGCDLPESLLESLGIRTVDLSFRFDGENREYKGAELSRPVFYGRMRGGAVARTAAPSLAAYTEAFEAELANGNDVLYLGLSSGLSAATSTASIAARELAEKYPERTLLTVDTLGASLGQGMLVYGAAKTREHGLSVIEAAREAYENRLSVCHLFTVDDLAYLRRGGRISAAAAVTGAMLGVKPVLHADAEGRLVSLSKARSRKRALRALAEKYLETAFDPQNGTVFISHADCLADARTLDSLLFELAGAHAELISDIGPVIGTHSGPGTVALFYKGNER